MLPQVVIGHHYHHISLAHKCPRRVLVRPRPLNVKLVAFFHTCNSSFTSPHICVQHEGNVWNGECVWASLPQGLLGLKLTTSGKYSFTTNGGQEGGKSKTGCFSAWGCVGHEQQLVCFHRHSSHFRSSQRTSWSKQHYINTDFSRLSLWLRGHVVSLHTLWISCCANRFLHNLQELASVCASQSTTIPHRHKVSQLTLGGVCWGLLPGWRPALWPHGLPRQRGSLPPSSLGWLG